MRGSGHPQSFSAYLEGELCRSERDGLEAHLRACPSCVEELHLLRQVLEALESLPTERTSARFAEMLDVRIDRDPGLRRLEDLRRLLPLDRRPRGEIRKSPSRRAGRVESPARRVTPASVLRARRAAPLHAAAAGLLLFVLAQILSPESRDRASHGIPVPSRPAEPAIDGDSFPPAAGDDAAGLEAPMAPSIAPVSASSSATAGPANEGAGYVPAEWTVTDGSDPAALRLRARELAARVPFATVLAERDGALVLSVPREALPDLRTELGRLGEVQELSGAAGLDAQTQVVLTFGEF